jgi:hypothetical protein
LHPLLFAIQPVVFAFSRGTERFAPADVAIPLLVALAAALAVWSALRWFMGDWQRSGLVVSLTAFLFVSTGFVRLAAPESWGLALAIAWALLGLAAGAFLIRMRAGLALATRVANVMGAVVVAIPALQIASFAIESRGAPRATLGRPLPAPPVARPGALRPDIYLIVLDAYARADVLASIYGHDNRGFLEFLEGRGFRVAHRASSNYGQTDLSLASMLNLDYLDALVEQLGSRSDDHHPLHDLIENSWLRRFLTQRGYTTVAFATGYPPARIETADVVLEPAEEIDAFRNQLANTTPLASLRSEKQARRAFDVFRERIRFTLNHLGRVSEFASSPLFAIAHIETPHPPFVFGPAGENRYPGKRFHDRDGNWLIGEGGLTPRRYRARYRDQVIFLNRELRVTIAAILANSPEPPIIVLTGDHGPRSNLVWNDADATDHWEAMGILSAYHLPGGGDDDLDPGFSPVNAFRLVLDRYFDTDLGLLENRSFFSTARHPYDFVDVTENIQASADARAARAGGRSAR